MADDIDAFRHHFRGKDYIQTCTTAWLPGDMLLDKIGVASYHFGETPSSCYIDYRAAPDGWRFDCGKTFKQLPQSRKYFTDVRVGRDKRFYGEIDWHADGLSISDSVKWIYDFQLDDDYKHISVGTCKMLDVDGECISSSSFGQSLMYQIFVRADNNSAA